MRINSLTQITLSLFHRKIHSAIWHFRCFYYSALLGAKNLKVNGRIKIICPERLRLGDSVSINEGCIINAAGGVQIGDRSHISPGVIINSGELKIKDVAHEMRKHIYKPVTIENDVWVASGVIINPGVNIGAGCVVAAGSVVTRSMPSGKLVLGTPARDVGDI